AININEALPLVPEDITANWCSKVLGKTVKSAVITKEYHGTASKLIVDLTYEDGNDGPGSICVKGSFNTDLMAKMPVVNCHGGPVRQHRVWEPTEGKDLRRPSYDSIEYREANAVGNALQPWGVDTVRSNVEQLAKLHAGTWNPDESKFLWLTGSDNLAYFLIGALTVAPTSERSSGTTSPPCTRAGAPRLELDDDVWDEYRKLVFHGFAWATVDKGLQPEEYIFAMAERHCTAIVDHGTLELLESLPGHGKH
ncbi:kinase-like domain-containing protein, partial [Apiospora phragmitis]